MLCWGIFTTMALVSHSDHGLTLSVNLKYSLWYISIILAEICPTQSYLEFTLSCSILTMIQQKQQEI